MKNDRVEQQLENLRALRALGPTEAAAVVLCKALRDRMNVVVAKAAAISAEFQLKSLASDLLQAFDRLFEKTVETDRQCWAKTAIAPALKDLGHAESPPFLRGLRHIQMEPVWGGEKDTAAALRGTCVLALVHARTFHARIQCSIWSMRIQECVAM